MCKVCTTPPSCPLAPQACSTCSVQTSWPHPNCNPSNPSKRVLCVQDFCPTVHALRPPSPLVHTLRASVVPPKRMPCAKFVPPPLRLHPLWPLHPPPPPQCTPCARFVHPPREGFVPCANLVVPIPSARCPALYRLCAPSPVHALCASWVSSRCLPCAKCVQPPRLGVELLQSSSVKKDLGDLVDQQLSSS